MLRSVIVLVFLALLGGCASLQRDAGFEVTEKSAAAVRQEPWQNMALLLPVFDRIGVVIVPVALPKPLPREWSEDFVDTARTHTVRVEGREVKRALQRVVFRAAFYDCRTEIFRGLYDAVLTPTGEGFFVFVPYQQHDSAKESCLVIATSSGTTVMTVSGEMVPLPKGTTLDRLPAGFFQRHPSPTMPSEFRYIRVWEAGAEIFLAELMTAFPEPVQVKGKWYAGRPNVTQFAGRFTAVEKPADILISCTNFKVGPGLTWLSAALYLWQAGEALSTEDCKKMETLFQRLQRNLRENWQQVSQEQEKE